MIRHFLVIAALGVLFGAIPLSAATPGTPATPPPATSATAASTLTVTGTLTTGVMAMGGETTGITLSDGKTTYELDIKDDLLKRKAQELSGKQATVKGTLTIKEGVEVGTRRIILVSSLEPAAGGGPAASGPK